MDGVNGLLTSLVFLPLVAAAGIALLARSDRQVRWAAGAVALAQLVLSIVVFASYDRDAGGLQMVDRVTDWVPIASFNVEYFLAVDGLSAPMVLLTGLLGMAAVYASWGIKHRVKEYFVWLLVLQTAVLGVFTALDFLMFFLFWELELVPMFFLISTWGSGRKEYSAMKFLLFTFIGSAFMLVGNPCPVRLVRNVRHDRHAGPDPEWSKARAPRRRDLRATLRRIRREAPGLARSHMAAGCPHRRAHGGERHARRSTAQDGRLRDDPGHRGDDADTMADLSWLLATAGVINVLYGAVVTLRQTDMKRLVAFSSISHMGYVLIGLSAIAAASAETGAIGLTGAAMQMFTHGTITGLMFLMGGPGIRPRTHPVHTGPGRPGR